MIHLDGYQIIKELFNGQNSRVFRGIREIDKLPVIIKKLQNDYPAPQELGRFKSEFEITRLLKIPGTIRSYDYIKQKNCPLIIQEDIGGESLAILLPDLKLNLKTKLTLSIELADILCQIHRENIIHMDINPSNIVWNPAEKILKVIDFGLSTQLSHHNSQIQNLDFLKGTIDFISPEQTGRMNRTVDYRSDLYSFGATLYYLFSGARPFNFDDLEEIVYSHIARTPENPSNINQEIPETLSKIILKLMAKAAEERYQSASGLKYDLEQCLLFENEKKDNIQNFVIGAEDVSERLEISQKLYGRENELQILLNAFENVFSGVPETILVAGYSGVGKSSLLHELYKQPSARQAYFTAGKFEQYRRNTPYSALIKAFADLSETILTEPPEKLKLWNKKIKDALGKNAQIIVDVIPKIELIIGKQPPVQELGAMETLNRFNHTFQKFVNVFVSKDHPLVIFLDDLQWADNASLNLIKVLITDPNTRYLLLLGAFRDNEVNQTHPLLITTAEIREKGGKLRSVTLQPLEKQSVEELLTDTLRARRETVKDLAFLLMEKTGGNPFFMGQFLFALYEDKLLKFNITTKKWDWDIEQINERDLTDNVVELMIQKIRKLPETTQKLLQTCSCIGSAVSLNTLAIICDRPARLLLNDLWEALKEEILLPRGNDYKSLLVLEDEDKTRELEVILRFQHDRIQQAAYETIDGKELAAKHLEIGRLLFKHTPEKELEESVFDVIGHLNTGRELIENHEERVVLARLNLLALKKAMDSIAYKSARDYAEIGRVLLPEDAWLNNYDLTLQLHKLGAQCEHQCGYLEKSNYLFDQIKLNARTNLEKAEIVSLRLLNQIGLIQTEEALEYGREALALCGTNFPAYKEISGAIPAAHETVHKLLSGLAHNEILNAPNMTDKKAMLVLEILLSMATACYPAGDINGITLTVLMALEVTLTRGRLDLSAQAYCWYAILLVAGGRHKEAYQFARLGYDVSEIYPECRQKAQLNNMFGAILFHWGESFDNCIKILREGYQIGMERGDFLYGSFCIANITTQSLANGAPLPRISEMLDRNLQEWYRNNLVAAIDNQQTERNFIGFLCDEDSRYDITDENYPPDQLTRIKNTYGWTYLSHYRMQKEFWLGNYKQALELSDDARDSLVRMPGFPVELEHYFYFSLSISGYLGEDPGLENSEFQKWLKKLKESKKKYKTWAKICPENCLHKYRLIQGEHAHILGKQEAALKYYNEAIELSHNRGYLQHEALANELCARYWLKRGQKKYAGVHMSDAIYLYKVWGAQKRIKILNEKFPDPLKSFNHEPRRNASLRESIDISTTNHESFSEAMDFKSVMKASRAISREINREKLLKNMMTIILENAGARRGFLILLNGEEAFIEAVISEQQVEDLISTPLEKYKNISHSIPRYVLRSGENVVIHNGDKEIPQSPFAEEPYLQKNSIRSLFCIPIRHQDRISGALYLENDLTDGAFTSERIELLEILLAQAAVSLENTKMYENLEELVTERTRELEIAHKKILDTAHRAGMAEVATGVLHNVGNALNSAIVPAGLLREGLNNLKIDSLKKLSRLLEENRENLEEFLGTDERGKKLPGFIAKLDHFINEERENMSTSLTRLQKSLTHIKEVIRMQQSYAGGLLLEEELDLSKLLEDALQMEYATIESEKILITREYTSLPPVKSDRHKLMLILINLLSNARESLFAIENTEKKIFLTLENGINGEIRIKVKDTGAGIAPKNIGKIFQHGFTTRKTGHGFGLHTAANAATELGGSLTAESEGLGKGATFILSIPSG